MIQDLSLTLKALLVQSLGGTPVIFARPTDSFKPERSSINLFLYDIRENLEFRLNDTVKVRQNGQYQLTYPLKRMDCSYLITAWPVGVTGEDLFLQEHRLLGQVLQILSKYPHVPADFLRGSLIGQDGQTDDPPIPLTISHLDSLKTVGEFWTAIGGQLRPSLSVTLTFSLKDAQRPITADIATSIEIRYPDVTPFIPDVTLFRIGGRILDNRTPPQPIPQALVTLVEPNLTTTTDAEGQYQFNTLSSGTYTLRAQFNATSQQKSIRVPQQEDGDYTTYQRDYDLQLT